MKIITCTADIIALDHQITYLWALVLESLTK